MHKTACILLLAVTLLAIALLAGCRMDTVTLYFPEGDTGTLAAEERAITDTEDYERAAILALMEGPRTEGLVAPIPAGTQLLDFKIDGKVAVIDFSEEIRTNHPGGSMGEMLTIYAIADTMGGLPTVERVKILVEGQEIETLLGHMDASGEIDPNWDIVKE
jgi:germination protein M